MIRSILCLIANPTAPTTKYFRPSTVPCHRQISRMDSEPEPDSRSGLNNRYTATINTSKIEKLVNTAIILFRRARIRPADDFKKGQRDGIHIGHWNWQGYRFRNGARSRPRGPYGV